ncbi:peptidase S41 protein [Pedobacter sp. HDW13]|uniref:S41 family peptidase n=1 Tax=unclassified Pedobacter TaxID=2628915 RepID=UPI000F5A30AE|nr:MULTISPECIES: S41 family peptidase [unclassified Pedobacter]QIL41073.1 peptidase S41 protein [Pedobacter sp. HDW13]RQO64155.1 peptidase S41 protein [Pedobacter sp. KBW01]
MKYLLLLLICLLTFNVNAQKTTTQDSIKVFYDELFSALKIGYLHKKAVNWPIVESETKQNLAQYSNFKNSLNETKPLFDKIKATHCLVYHKQDKYSATRKIISKDNYSAQWKKKYDTKPVFEAKVIDGKYGYILMPGMVFFDTSPENIHKIAQPLYDQIAEVKAKHKIEGWIIDLRFNTGGNSWPMLLALYDFLGDHYIGGSLNINKKQDSKIKLSKGRYIDNAKSISYITPTGALLDKAKVAVITGVLTGSSGEVTALAFKGRANTTFIGESTAGFTTGNIFWPLPFDITMALTNSYDSDRNGNYYEQIIPDIVVSKQDNFDDLLLDKNIQEAIKFIMTV